jgi:hypothetical protein
LDKPNWKLIAGKIAFFCSCRLNNNLIQSLAAILTTLSQHISPQTHLYKAGSEYFTIRVTFAERSL